MMILETQRRLAQVFPPEQANVLAEVIEESYRDLVKIGDFNELKAVVKELSVEMKELAQQQKQTSAEVKELAEQQKQTSAEVKSLTVEVRELAEQQKQISAEVKALSVEMRELAEQQKQTSAEVKELAEQQKRTSAEVKELAEQQKQTSAEVKALSVEMRELVEQQKKSWIAIESLNRNFHQEVNRIDQELKRNRQEIGGLATTVGYRLEDESYKALPQLLQRDFEIQVIGKIKRGYLHSKKGEPLEINILGKLKQHDQEFLLVGEAKSQLSKKYVDEFIRKKLNHLPAELAVFPLLVTYMTTTPEVEDYVHDKGITLYYSYDF